MPIIEPPSPITKLLSDISWEGRLVAKKYRNGGQGMEVVLTTEVLQLLHYLPRKPFLEAALSTLKGDNCSFSFSGNEIERSEVVVFPYGQYALKPSAETHQEQIGVQPDGLIVTPETFALIEAKRIKSSSFQPEQLARNFLVALREAKDRRPLLILILGKEPPVKISGTQKRMSVHNAIVERIGDVYNKIEGLTVPLDEAKGMINETVFWTTWHDIASIITKEAANYLNPDSSTEIAVKKLARDLARAVEWHS